MKKLLTIAVIINRFFILDAQTLSTPVTSHIHVDQFGYLPAGNKVAVISDPQTGFNAALAYTPATSLSVHDAANNNLINSFNRTSWNSNATWPKWRQRLVVGFFCHNDPWFLLYL